MWKRIAIITAAAALVVTPIALITSSQAGADGCATHSEYDNLIQGLSDQQVANRLDTNGTFISTGTTFWKRGYDACWDDTRKVVVWFALNNGLSDHWDVRDK